MKISVRQICFIMFMYTFATKVLTYPSALAATAGRDLIFSALIDFAISGVVIWSLAYMCSRTQMTFFEMLKATFGRVGMIITGVLFALFFTFSAFFPLFEQERYVHAIFYDTIPSYLTCLPFFAFAVYAACKGFTNIGRCADLCLPVFVLSVVFIFTMCVSEINFEHMLPILKTPASGIFAGALKNAFRFTEPAFMLFFVGRFKYKKGDAAKITLSYAGGALLVILTLFAFYGIYSDIAPDTPFAISKLSLFFSAINIVGRVDLIALYALEIVQLFALVLNIQLAVYCIKTCIYPDDSVYDRSDIMPFIAFCVNAALLAAVLLCDSLFSSVTAFYSDWGWIILVIFAVIAPLLCWALKKRREQNG